MLDVTGWVLAVWLKWTLILAAGVGAAWLTLTADSVWFWTIAAAAGWVECYIIRQLGREWAHEAHLSWWWAR